MITVTDLFCGAGGSSIGAEGAGVSLRMAANHWRLAVDTHAANFPGADHDCADVSQVDPRRYPRTEILLASPECTTHSRSGGRRHEPDLFDPDGDPRVERSRATMWDVPRFTEFHGYEAIVVENVVEVRRWAPYPAWLETMRLLGYRHREVFLNSMVAHPTPQSRDRLYVVFWREAGRPVDLELPAIAWCPACAAVVEGYQAWKRLDRAAGKYRSQYLYRCPSCRSVVFPFAHPASDAIDWSLPAPRIGDRQRPLAPATRRRAQIALDRYGPALIQAAGHTYEAGGYVRAWSLGQPIPVQTGTVQHAVVLPTRPQMGVRGRPSYEPWPAQTARQEQALVIIPLRANAEPTPAAWAPLPTVVAGGNHHAIVVPYRGRASASTTGDPLPTQDTRDRFALLLRNYGDHGGRDLHGKPTSAPFGTVTTADHHSLLDAASIDLDDCGFRMLEPHEIQAAMAFPASYAVGGCKRDRVRQLGNAVTPPAMRLILSRVVEALA